MKLIACTLLMGLTALSCSNDYYRKYTTYEFVIENNNPNNFGYEEISDGPNFSVSSLALQDNYVFMMDKFHGNIKRVDIGSGQVITGKKLETHRNPLINDIICTNNKLIVLTELDIMYVLDMDLNVIKQLNIDRGDKFFIKREGALIDICNLNEHKVDSYDDGLHVVSSRKWDGKGIFGKVNLLQEYSFETINNKKIIETEYGTVSINGTFPGEDLEYEARCLTYNKNTLVYYSLSGGKVLLHIFKH